MSIDPNKAFGMKATNKSYTLEFRREDNGTTELTATDLETVKMSFAERFSAAWAILTGKKRIGELVFPIRLRNTDFYHLSFIYRPEKKAAEKPVTEAPAKPKAEKPKAPAKPKATKPKAEKAIESTKATAEKPVKKVRAPRKPKTENPA